MSARRHPRTLSPTWSLWLRGGAWCTVGPLASQRSSGDWGDLVRLTGKLTKHPRPNQLRMQFGRRVKILEHWGVSVCIIEPFVRGFAIDHAKRRWCTLPSVSARHPRKCEHSVFFSFSPTFFFFFSFWEVSYDFPYIEQKTNKPSQGTFCLAYREQSSHWLTQLAVEPLADHVKQVPLVLKDSQDRYRTVPDPLNCEWTFEKDPQSDCLQASHSRK